jgi:hypothetical protein
MRVLMVSKGWPTRHFVVPETVPARKLGLVVVVVGDLNAGWTGFSGRGVMDCEAMTAGEEAFGGNGDEAIVRIDG